MHDNDLVLNKVTIVSTILFLLIVVTMLPEVAAVLEVILLALLYLFVVALAVPIPFNSKRYARLKSLISRPLAFIGIPLFLSPFILAVVFESRTNILPDRLANFLFFNGRHFLPLSYMYTPESNGLYPFLKHPTHVWGIGFWYIVTMAYGFFTQRVRLRYSFIISPFLIILISVAFEHTMRQFGFVFWGLPFRVIR